MPPKKRTAKKMSGNLRLKQYLKFETHATDCVFGAKDSKEHDGFGCAGHGLFGWDPSPTMSEFQELVKRVEALEKAAICTCTPCSIHND